MAKCEKCMDSGMMVVVGADGGRTAEICACCIEARYERRIRRLMLPPHYHDVSLDDYETDGNPSFSRALGEARKYVAEYKPGSARGLLFQGSVGTGKTHLAVSILKEASAKGATGLFCDFREVLKRLQATFSGKSNDTEMDILRPLTHSDIVVIDELGAARVTDWTFDVVEHLINMRYNEHRATIVTTNYPFRGPGVSEAATPITSYARAQAREESLGDRIGARMFSRLCEMCQVIEMQGADYRAKRVG